MPLPSSHTKHRKTTRDFLSVSRDDFARLSTEEKFRHVHLGMVELTRALVELAAAAKASNQ
jgi:hypothetical protein